ncbi:MAG: hypothetical protein IKP86_10305 [Anaerolineaceae bacterium]|nr:hypothetical protein [Anaerolineaceae bacterium]
MIDKITAKIKRYPFQTGIVIGVLACLLLVGFISLFQDHGKTLAGNSEIIMQDYLRMSISEYEHNANDQLAEWRYKHLGRKAGETLRLMRGDESVSPYALVSFAKAVGAEEKIESAAGKSGPSGNNDGTPVSPKKGLSTFGKILLWLLGILILAAGGFYAASLIQTRKKQKRRSEMNTAPDLEPINMITPEKARAAQAEIPDTLFDLEQLFSTPGDTEKTADTPADLIPSDETQEEPSAETVREEEPDVPEVPFTVTDVKTAVITEEEDEVVPEKTEETMPVPENDDDDYPEEIDITDFVNETASSGENPEEPGGVKYEISGYEVSSPEEEEPAAVEEESTESFFLKDDESKTVDIDLGEDKTGNEQDDNAEKPLVETDAETEQENEDELLKMIREGKTNSDEILGKTPEELPDEPEEPEEASEPEEEPAPEAEDVPENEREESTDDILIHYQSGYRIGNDMYDEVFSIDQGDVFRGECGISIGETLNNTEPKAVTAFEVWLFDKDDIHTATWYLMSDFAVENDGIRQRLEQRGNCDRIRKNDLYTLETETLLVEIKVLELEYGTEMEEKNSYFTNVVFDVVARQKKAAE